MEEGGKDRGMEEEREEGGREGVMEEVGRERERGRSLKKRGRWSTMNCWLMQVHQ